MPFRHPAPTPYPTHRDKVAHRFIRRIVSRGADDAEQRLRLRSIRLSDVVDVLHQRDPLRDTEYPSFVVDFPDYLDCARNALLAWYRANEMDASIIERDCTTLGTITP